MAERMEKEDKYLIEKIPDDFAWDRKVLIYQIFDSVEAAASVQTKIIFRYDTGKINACRVFKKVISSNVSHKTTEYLDISSVDLESFLGRRFLIKKRYIKEPLFLDIYEKNNGELKQLLEIEDDWDESLTKYFGAMQCVSGEAKYSNECLSVEFKEEDLETLRSFLQRFAGESSGTSNLRK